MRLRLLDTHYHAHGREGCHFWPQGEERDVPQETADYLLGTFPGRFAVSEAASAPDAVPESVPAPIAAVVPAPPRAVVVSSPERSPARRGR